MTLDRTQTDDEAAPAPAVELPFLHVAFDGAHPCAAPLHAPLAGIASLTLGRGDAVAATRIQDGARWLLRLDLDDGQVSREHARIEADRGAWRVTDLGSRNGTWLDGARLPAGTAVSIAPRSQLHVGRALVLVRDEPPPGAAPLSPTRSPAWRAELVRLARLVDASCPPVLLRGPVGSGKEVVARAIHARLASRGRDGAFVAVNCGAIAAGLVESELFGATRGAYSGANEDRLGLVRAAHGGTLFLDEIGDMPLAAQPALLRVLQEREVLPVGATRAQPVDVAVVAATHRDLGELVAAGRFRADLCSRLVGADATLPALCERIEDLGLLAGAILAELGSDVRFSGEAVRALSLYRWPHNVRELRAALAHAAALAEGVVQVEHLPRALQVPAQDGADDLRDRLAALLARHRGNVAAVARDLGEHRRQVQRWLERFGIDPAAHRR